MKRIILIFSTLLLLLSGASAYAQTGKDTAVLKATVLPYYPVDFVSYSDTNAYDKVTALLQAGVIKGSPNTGGSVKLNPEGTMTRAEFFAMLVNAAELNSKAPAPSFSDVQAGAWYAEPIRIATSLGFAKGYPEGTFRPNSPITRAEMTAVMVSTFKNTVQAEGKIITYTDLPINDWYTPAVQQAAKMGLLDEQPKNLFQPQAPAKRIDAMLMVYNALFHESSALPNDWTLTNLVQDVMIENYMGLNNKDFDRIANAAHTYATGFFTQYLLLNSEGIASLTNDGNRVFLYFEGSPHAEIQLKADRYAMITVTGYTDVSRVIYPNGSVLTKKVPIEDTLYLRKKGNDWFVFGSKNGYLSIKEWLQPKATVSYRPAAK
ncbi:S-layer homology domain-containing protein [Gorillibacterium massiliense]|uniref:S-layer homology domain-containing protein n=1 Tax=Gorillibacterium massiliense TaxID=1280390 RepID=UPI0004BA773C|nr:S-layer homology domain-containing protein [Gorillibacterium massiliense]